MSHGAAKKGHGKIEIWKREPGVPLENSPMPIYNLRGREWEAHSAMSSPPLLNEKYSEDYTL